MALGPDFRRLWSAYAISEFGTGIGFETAKGVMEGIIHGLVRRDIGGYQGLAVT